MFELSMESYGFIVAVAVAVILIWLPFNWRAEVTVRRRMLIKASPQSVWKAIDLAEGDVHWHSHLDRVVALNDAGTRVRLENSLGDGASHWSYEMEITERCEGEAFVARRILDEKSSPDDRLLELRARIEKEGEGTALTWQEYWGPRSIAGRFMAHSDAAAALCRLRSYCENGKVCTKRAAWTAGWIVILSAFTTIAAFSVLLGWELALLMVFVLAVHEIGHLVSFRMIGQPWGRIMFVPFIGGVAVSRMPHKRLTDDVFCALMGAGLSIVLLVPAIVYAFFHAGPLSADSAFTTLLFGGAALVGAINLLNLLPVFPLDGGRVLRAMLQSFAPNKVRHVMFVVAGLMGGAAIFWQNAILAGLAIVAFFQSRRLGPSKDGVEKMDGRNLATMAAAYAALCAVHGAAVWAYLPIFIA